jgi:hypothetical protein
VSEGTPLPSPSGLFPGAPPRPAYREPHPVRPGPLVAGGAAGVTWLALFGLLATDLAGWAWWTLGAGAAAWVAALLLVRYGDRGVAVGVAAAVGILWAAAGGALALRWAVTGDWPMW